MTGSQRDWSPMQVLEHTLRVSGDALLDRDFTAFASIFELPHHITTFEGSRTLRTEDELRETFETVRTHCRKHNITSILRECIFAEFDDQDQIKSAHTTRWLAGAQQIGQTSMSYGVLRLNQDRWLTTSSQYAVADKKLSSALIITSGYPVNENSDPFGSSNGPTLR